MFELYADRNELTVRKKGKATSGSVNTCRVRFEFSEDWEGLERTAVFMAGSESRSVLLGEDGGCAVPWEVLAEPGRCLMAGVCGRRGEDVVLPTVWASLGTVREGALPGRPSRPPSPELWEQELARKGDRLAYTPEGELGLWSGDEALSSVPVGAGGGTDDHRRLTHREDAEQHPIGAITGLAKELERIPGPVEALTNLEMEEILK